MTDGLRWQEVFRGADPSLLIKANNGDQPVDALTARYIRSTPEESRAALMPFLWSQIVPNGEIYGNRDKGSDAYVTNGLRIGPHDPGLGAFFHRRPIGRTGRTRRRTFARVVPSSTMRRRSGTGL